jgi:Ca-activated chloride channel family protein
MKSNLVTCEDERGGFFTLILYPPKTSDALQRHPMEMVFVLDCSGSMWGRPLEQAKAAIARALRRLGPEDTFQIIRFSNEASQLGRKPLTGTPEHIGHGLRYLESLKSEGGTMMLTGVKAALDFPHDPARLRFVSFLTDGYIGNEAEILTEVHKRLGAARIFSFGVGPAVNRYLLDHMARLGQGAVAYLGPNDSPAQVMDDFFERISHPALVDVKVDWGDAKVSEVFPDRVPDLFVGRPVVLTGRITGRMAEGIRIMGNMGDREIELRVPARRDAALASNKSLPNIWARMKIADLAERSLYEPDRGWPDQIRRVALDFGLMSAYTAFVSVDSSIRTKGDSGTTVPVAVPVPEGVQYKTTVSE